MPNSTQFRTLTKSVNALRRELLPRRFDATGSYPDSVRTRAAGFRLLVLTYASSSNSILTGSATQLSNLPKVIEELKSAHEKFVRYATGENMGVRRANVLRLLLPVGIPEREIDPAWLQKIDAFGQTRGSMAHSPRGRVRQPVDPKGEFDTVSDIIEGIRVIDETLKQMKYRALSA